MIIIGTCHFVSRAAAVRYYRDYHYPDTEKAVARKISEGEIKIGPPELKPGQRLTTEDDGTRYAVIEEQ